MGDWVEIQETGPEEGMVWEILPRRTAFDRPAVANVDQLVVVASRALPVTDPFLIDRVVAHLVHPQGEPRLQCVEEAGLPHPGVARKGGDPAGHQPPRDPRQPP